MLARGRGHLVGISSLAARVKNPRTPVYGATKAALSFWLESIDMELRPRGVAVTAVEPGFIRTPAAEGVTEPMPFILETEAAVNILERAIRTRPPVVRFPWQLRTLIALPSLLPRRLARALTARVSMPGKRLRA